MRPIEFRADLQYVQALKCVEFRIPRYGHFRRPGYAAILGLRYGLIGIAATYHLLDTSSEDERSSIMGAMKSWQRLVEDHVHYELFDRLPFGQDEFFPHEVSRYAEFTHQLAIPSWFRLDRLDQCLPLVTDRYRAELRDIIRAEWANDLYAIPDGEFQRLAKKSIHFAKHFYARRQCNLPERPEIALLDE